MFGFIKALPLNQCMGCNQLLTLDLSGQLKAFSKNVEMYTMIFVEAEKEVQVITSDGKNLYYTVSEEDSIKLLSGLDQLFTDA